MLSSSALEILMRRTGRIFQACMVPIQILQDPASGAGVQAVPSSLSVHVIACAQGLSGLACEKARQQGCSYRHKKLESGARLQICRLRHDQLRVWALGVLTAQRLKFAAP